MPTTYTPLRYPGGKTRLYPSMRVLMEANGLLGRPYAEPFAGGAGLAVKLLLCEDVPRIVLNDADRAVYCLWWAVVRRPEDLCGFVGDVALDLATWRHHRDVYVHAGEAEPLELAEATLYLNRTNVSGILGARPMGGLGQQGACRLGDRFNRKTLRRKIRHIASHADRIEVTCMDAADFIEDRLGEGIGFAYIDPPYVRQGPSLYGRSLSPGGHRHLAESLSRCPCRWAMTYDDDGLVDELYGGLPSRGLGLAYSANRRVVGTQRLILGPGLRWPS